MKRRLVFLVLLLFLAVGGIWYLVFRQSGMYRVREGIPEDAVFIVETPSFNRIRDKLYRNRIWASLKAYPYFEEYHANLNLADSLSEVYPGLRKLLTDRPFAVSCHLVSATDYDLLYVCDLGKLNVIQAFDGLVGGVLGDGQMSRKGDVTGIRIGELKLYYAIKANLLFISFSEKLVTRAWKTCGRHPAFQEQSNTGDIRLELEHTRFEKWMKMLWGEAATNADSSAFETTALALQLQDKALAFSGKTYPSRHNFSLWSALNLVEGNKSSVREIIGNHVAAYVSVCYSSFEELENILLEDYKVNNLKEFQGYEKTVTRLNKFLGLDLAGLFTSWMGNEIAIVKPAVDQENRLDNLILAIRAKDIDLAKDQLAYLAEQIGRKTPVRFRNIDYNGHTIGYLSLKGFFNMFLGKWFSKFDKPYYTFIGDYVVFSNSSSTLAAMIKDYSLGNTLVQDEKYNDLMSELGNRSNIYGYVSSPETYEYLFRSLPPEDRAEFVKNKGAFQSFEAIGFTLTNAGSGYETHLVAIHNVDAARDYEIRELSRSLEKQADLIESGYYHVVIPDSIAVSTRGDYAYRTEQLDYAGKLSNGDPEGIWKITDRQGQVVAQLLYREGKLQGESRFFYPDGVVAVQVTYDNGKITAYKEFFSDGTLKTELEYNRGLRHGEARFYYPTGHLFGEGKYKKGRRTGTWKYYKVTGEIEKKLKF